MAPSWVNIYTIRHLWCYEVILYLFTVVGDYYNNVYFVFNILWSLI